MKPIRCLTALALVLAPLPELQGMNGSADQVSQEQQADEIDDHRAALDRPGPEAAEARQTAIENLLSMLSLRAQGVLQDKLRQEPDPDEVRLMILESLVRRLRIDSDSVFGMRAGEEHREVRLQIVKSWVSALVPFFVEDWKNRAATPSSTLWQAARACLIKLQPGELDEGLRAVVDDPEQAPPIVAAAFCAASESQDLFFARLLADYLEDPKPSTRAAARYYLKVLTFSLMDFATRAEFEAWRQKNGSKTYKQLAEEAARNASGHILQLEDEADRRVKELTVSLVTALLENRGAVDWAEVQRRVLQTDPPGLVEACLERLREKLRDDLHTHNNARERQAFHQALLEEFERLGDGQPGLRSLLLETAAYLLRPGEGEIATEMEQLLIARLPSTDLVERLAALRGLSRFPSPRNRAAVLQAADRAITELEDGGRETLRVALGTLGRRNNPAWSAPSPDDGDKAQWLELLGRIFKIESLAPLRREALEVTRLPDASGARLPEVFRQLMALAQDEKQTYEVRKTSLIYLQDYTVDLEERADKFVRCAVDLLADPVPEIREYAAKELLSRLPDHSDKMKREWLNVLVANLRERLQIEANPKVFDALVACMTAAARPPGRPESAIGALQHVIGVLAPGSPQGGDSFKIDRLCQALTSLAAEPLGEDQAGLWILTGETLLEHRKRIGLRHVLTTQGANGQGKKVGEDGVPGELARKAMMLIIGAAKLKPARESWSDPGLRDEASDVRSAFVALQRVQADPDDPESRLLHIEVLAGTGLHGRVIELAKGYLAPDDNPRSGQPLSAAQKDAVRLLLAGAYLATGQVDQAEVAYSPVDEALVTQPEALDLGERLGVALLRGKTPSPGRALPVLQRVFESTRQDDARFRHRLLAYAQALEGTDANGNRGLLAKLLSDSRGVFEAADCPAELKAEWEALRERIGSE